MKTGAINFFVKPFANEVLLGAIRESLEQKPRRLSIVKWKSVIFETATLHSRHENNKS